jgi:thiamine-phosphate pyrophosphorylase
VELPARRLLDANLNRAREALRTLEDVARLGFDDEQTSAEAKAVRHELREVAEGVDLLAARDAAGDVGTSHTTVAEASRQDLADVALAAGKRAGEAMRVLEEVLKLEAGDAAGRVKQLRYRVYDLERRVALISRPRKRFATVEVYVLITEAFCRRDWLATAEAALAGGAECLQLREPELPAGELLRRAVRLRELCRAYNALLVINDRPDVAMLARADGVHVGQDDLPAAEVRRIVGRDRIVGVSTHEIGQVRRANADGADYVGVGPVFASKTKPRDFLPGLAFAQEAAAANVLPTVAIAGITTDNVDEVWATGVSTVAATTAVTQAEDIAVAVAALRKKS